MVGAMVLSRGSGVMGTLAAQQERVGLTRISHQLSTAAADPGMSTSLRSVGLLDILSSMPAGPLEVYIFTLGAKRQAPCPSAPPRYEIW
jgi:hypothetical protein